jgi:hypothetical protein
MIDVVSNNKSDDVTVQEGKAGLIKERKEGGRKDNEQI